MNSIQKGIRHLSKSDKVISRLIKKFGNCNLQPRNDYFNSLLNIIIGQQLSLTAAESIAKKFYSHFGKTPAPEKIIRSRETTLRRIGLSRAKTIYVKALSEAVLKKELLLDSIDNRDDEEIIENLTRVKGIGIWSAHMFLIFNLCRLNVLPVGDLGIRKSIMLNYGLENSPNEDEIIKISERNRWQPYSSIAAYYLWKSLDN